MDFHIDLAAFTLVGLILYCLNKWAFKGEIFHPGLIYSLVNGGIFLVFALGPYNYDLEIDWYYYYTYALITITFIIGINLGTKKKKFVKEINLSSLSLLILFLIVICLNIWQLNSSILVSNDLSLSLEGAVENMHLRGALGNQIKEVNLIKYVITQLINSITIITTSIFLASSLKKKKYLYILIWFFLAILMILLSGSRTIVFKFGFAFAVPWLIVTKYTLFRKITISTKTFRKFFKRHSKKLISLISIILVLIFIISNVRSKVEIKATNTNKKYRYELIEPLFKAQKKEWFYSIVNNVDPSIVNPLAELSIYAGGTVATGGVASRIASQTGWHTWGLRNFFVVHRILSWLQLDNGFSDYSRNNFYKIVDRASLELPIFKVSWLSDPGNFILDFGYIIAFLPSLITGFLIGSIYSSFSSQNNPIISSLVTSIFAFPMFITPSISFFGPDLSNAINFFVLICYFWIKSRKKPKQYYLIVDPQLQDNKKPNHYKI